MPTQNATDNNIFGPSYAQSTVPANNNSDTSKLKLTIDFGQPTLPSEQHLTASLFDQSIFDHKKTTKRPNLFEGSTIPLTTSFGQQQTEPGIFGNLNFQSEISNQPFGSQSASSTNTGFMTETSSFVASNKLAFGQAAPATLGQSADNIGAPAPNAFTFNWPTHSTMQQLPGIFQVGDSNAGAFNYSQHPQLFSQQVPPGSTNRKPNKRRR